MAKTRQQKQDIVTVLSDKLARAKSIVFADYQGLTMAQLSTLRGRLKEFQAEFSVTKNTLLKLAAENAKLGTGNLQTGNVLEGAVATLFAFDDEITPIKILVKAFGDFTKGKVKGGFLGWEYLDQYRVLALSDLPSKRELQGKMVGVLESPLQGIVGVLNANLRGLAYALDQIRQLAEITERR